MPLITIINSIKGIRFVSKQPKAHATLHLGRACKVPKRQCLVALHAHYFYLLTTHLPVAIVVNVAGRSPILTANLKRIASIHDA